MNAIKLTVAVVISSILCSATVSAATVTPLNHHRRTVFGAHKNSQVRYLEHVRVQLRNYFPHRVKPSSIDQNVVVRFAVNRDGSISNVDFDPSDTAEYPNDAFLSELKSAPAFSPLPASFGDKAVVKYQIYYRRGAKWYTTITLLPG
jgi:hypothetical protein